MRMRQRMRRLRGLRSERGAALVEFALVVPLLMLITCAAIDFGLAVYTLNNLTAAVREGGRYAATIPKPGPVANDSRVQDRVYRYISGMNNGLTAAQTKALITVSAPDAVTGDVTVQITGYPFRPLTPLSTLFGLATVSLNRKATFRYEFTSAT
jgi:Flp pilus assembly protein TadG